MRVLIVEDDDFTRTLLVTAVRALGHDCVGDCATAADAMRIASAHAPDLALLDLDLGDGPTGVDLGHALRGRDPAIGLVILSSYEEPRLLGVRLQIPDRAVYLVKQSIGDPDSLGRALRIAADPTVHTAASTPPAREKRSAALSDGQVEIMRLVAAGYTNAEIGRRRYMTEHAVGKAVARLVKQLELDLAPGDNPRILIAQAYFAMTGSARPRRD